MNEPLFLTLGDAEVELTAEQAAAFRKGNEISEKYAVDEEEAKTAAWKDLRKYDYASLVAFIDDAESERAAIMRRIGEIDSPGPPSPEASSEGDRRAAEARIASWTSDRYLKWHEEFKATNFRAAVIRTRLAVAREIRRRRLYGEDLEEDISAEAGEAIDEQARDIELRDLATEWKEEFNALAKYADGRNVDRMELFRRAAENELDEDTNRLYNRFAERWKRRLDWPSDVGELERLIKRAVRLRDEWDGPP